MSGWTKRVVILQPIITKLELTCSHCGPEMLAGALHGHRRLPGGQCLDAGRASSTHPPLPQGWHQLVTLAGSMADWCALPSWQGHSFYRSVSFLVARRIRASAGLARTSFKMCVCPGCRLNSTLRSCVRVWPRPAGDALGSLLVHSACVARYFPVLWSLCRLLGAVCCRLPHADPS
jgi:hypothetical protein